MTDFDLKVDSETGQLYAEDPETGDRQPVPFDEIGVNNAGVGSLDADSVNTEVARIGSVDAKGFQSGYSLSVGGPLSASEPFEFRTDNQLIPKAQLINPEDLSVTHTLFANGDDDLYIINDKGQLEHLGEATSTSGLAIDYVGNILVVESNVGEDWNIAKYYTSVSNMESDSPTHTLDPCFSARDFSHVSMLDRSDSDHSTGVIMWAEYTPDDYESRIIKVSSDEVGFTTQLSLPDSEVRHFHSLDADVWNEGEYWATTGDSEDECRFYRSTDYGETWTEEAGGSLKYKTLRLNFGPDYVYWGLDARIDGSVRFYRAPRDDVENPEEIIDFGETPWGDYGSSLIYGSTYVERPHGIVIPLFGVTTTSQQWEEMPIFFWDIEQETLRRIFDLPVRALGSGNPQGIRNIAPFVDQNTNKIYSRARRVDQWRDELDLGLTFEMNQLNM